MNDRLQEAFSVRGPVLFIVLAVLFLGVFAKISYVMLWSTSEQELSEISRSVTNKPEPPRGKILDSDGNILATSIERSSLVANPSRVNEDDQWPLAKELAEILDQSSAALYKKITRDGRFVWVARKLSEEKRSRLKSLDHPALRFQPEYERVYPKGSMAGSVLGFAGMDNQGLAGIEQQFDGVLSSARPASAQRSVKTLAGSEETRKDVHVRLSLDQTIQHIVEEELHRVVEQENPDNAMVLAIEPETGKIRALVNWPNYNPNRYEDFDSNKRKNRILTSVYEPGSTLKPVTLAIGLAKGAFDSSSTFNCDGYVYLPQAKHTIHCHAEHGELTVPEILIQSCNVGVVKATQKMDARTYYRTLRDFGFGTWSGVQLPGEAEGSLRRPAKWSAMTKPSMAIGQGISATPLQVTNALSVLVNGGVLLKPRIVESVRRPGQSPESVDSFRIRRVVPESIADRMKRYMSEVVNRGTGQRASLEKYNLGGKTGTAQKPNREEGGYYQDKFLASFVGFGPTEDPELVVGVFLDNPKKHQYGGEVAAPLFRRIMKRSLRYYDRSGSSETVVSRDSSRN
jgi:cell division protein FtsI/penicillin-binding protein 2